jgi:hypothetical protein
MPFVLKLESGTLLKNVDQAPQGKARGGEKAEHTR